MSLARRSASRIFTTEYCTLRSAPLVHFSPFVFKNFPRFENLRTNRGVASGTAAPHAEEELAPTDAGADGQPPDDDEPAEDAASGQPGGGTTEPPDPDGRATGDLPASGTPAATLAKCFLSKRTCEAKPCGDLNDKSQTRQTLAERAGDPCERTWQRLPSDRILYIYIYISRCLLLLRLPCSSVFFFCVLLLCSSSVFFVLLSFVVFSLSVLFVPLRVVLSVAGVFVLLLC